MGVSCSDHRDGDADSERGGQALGRADAQWAPRLAKLRCFRPAERGIPATARQPADVGCRILHEISVN